MKLEYFDYILEVDRLHSISAAARSLHMRQSTLRSIVKSVEDEYGFLIFQRTPSRVITTPAGEQFMAAAWEISIRYNELLALKQRDIISSSRAIKVLITSTIATSLPCEIIKYFRRFEVQGNLVFEEADKTELETHIADHTANISLSYLTLRELTDLQDQTEKSDFVLEKLLIDHLYLVTAEGHPLARRPFVSIETISNERIAVCKISRNDSVLGNFYYQKNSADYSILRY